MTPLQYDVSMDNHARDAAVRRVRALRYAILAYPDSEQRRLLEWLHTDNPRVPGMLPPCVAAWRHPIGAELAHALLITFAAHMRPRPRDAAPIAPTPARRKGRRS